MSSNVYIRSKNPLIHPFICCLLLHVEEMGEAAFYIFAGQNEQLITTQTE